MNVDKKEEKVESLVVHQPSASITPQSVLKSYGILTPDNQSFKGVRSILNLNNAEAALKQKERESLPIAEQEALFREEAGLEQTALTHPDHNVLTKSLTEVLDNKPHRQSFTRNPWIKTIGANGLFRYKYGLVVDDDLKRLAVRDGLLATIIRIRSNHISSFGRIQTDRHDVGYKIKMRQKYVEDIDADKIQKLEHNLLTCGEEFPLELSQDRCSFAEYLRQTVRNILTVGRAATEVVYRKSDSSIQVQEGFSYFRPTDAGTIYFAERDNTVAGTMARERAQITLKQMEVKNPGVWAEKGITADRVFNGDFAWWQVFNGMAINAFTDKEMLVFSPYSVIYNEFDGYPLSPIESGINEILTHMFITLDNKLQFQNGRMSKGMLVLQSEDADDTVIAAIKQNFNASINSVLNAHRMPVFGIGPNDKMQWVPYTTQSAADMEYQYLSDNAARIMCSVFDISPEEIPGLQHLVRGNNAQALSESNQEYKLTAARDVGLIPLMNSIEDFISDYLLPLIDPEFGHKCRFCFVGLTADTAEKESTRLKEDTDFLTYNTIMERLESKKIDKEFGGDFPFNPQWQQIIEKYLTFGQIREKFFGDKDASKKPELDFYQNQAWFTWQGIYQQQLMQQQAQQLQAQQGNQLSSNQQQNPDELSNAVKEAMKTMGVNSAVTKSENPFANSYMLGKAFMPDLIKAEHQLNPAIKQLRKTIEQRNKDILADWHKEKEQSLEQLSTQLTNIINKSVK
jgi:hypothetical protein